ncbi:Smr/MutS family protein [Rhizosaccharibacter radicis]|uniref:Smr/MutS family protein n=1 Tax=Rhizosaccharibacter radicis TaxID=2782605 RepID=A0ABT1VXQ0_9PROT|nr:Smr/MutS family protein [Acetobacteraceae bacterium KSS12]
MEKDGAVVRRLSDSERTLWGETMRQVRPLRPAVPAAPAPVASPASPAAALAEPAPVPGIALDPASLFNPRRPVGPPRIVRTVAPPLPVGERQPGLDDTSWRALSSGRMRPQRRLDLHGATAQVAFGRLQAFLQQAASERLRCVEVITGAGTGLEGGILRRELPHWLSRPDLRGLVLAAVHPHRANVGSVRLLLRRR